MSETTAALREILKTTTIDVAKGRALGAKLAKKDRETWAPLAARFKPSGHLALTQEIVVQLCLEQPIDHPLHEAARALLADGTIDWTPWTSIATSPRPGRATRALIISKIDPLAFALEDARVAVWSLLSGEHVRDLALPIKNGAGLAFAETAEGTIRVLSVKYAKNRMADGYLICECPRGGTKFDVALELEKSSSVFKVRWTPDLSLCATEAPYTSKQTSDPIKLLIHDVGTRTTREVELPGFHMRDASWCGERLCVIGTTSDANGDTETGHVFVVDGRTLAIDAVALAGDRREVLHVYADREDTLRLNIGGQYFELDLTTRALRPSAHKDTIAKPTSAAGDTYDPVRGTITFHQGRTLTYAPILSYGRDAAWDDARGQLVLWGSEDPDPAVTLVAPYDPARAAAMATRSPAPQAVSWSRAGVKLTYRIADFDVDDEYVFEITDASGDALVCEARMGDEVAGSARFTSAALARARKTATPSQGGFEPPLAAEEASRVPAFIVSRDAAKKLAAGKPFAWSSEWTESDVLTGGGAGAKMLAIDGGEVPVATREAAGAAVKLTWLDDPTWPLVIDRTEGDCFVRLIKIDFSGVQSAASADAPRPAATKQTAPTSQNTGPHFEAGTSVERKRFEMVEGGSSKFWEVGVSGPDLLVRYGKIGTSGQESTKTLASADAAQREMEKLVREKTKKGYVSI